MIDKYLPIGSVVLLQGGTKRIMIIGRRERARADGQAWDYLACPYPEGFLGGDNAYLFDHEQIARVFFLGFQDGEELALQEWLANADAVSDAGDANRHELDTLGVPGSAPA